MSVLRNLEAKLGGLVEGAFGRAFKTNVQPVELAHKLAKEMEDHQMASVSRVYVPNHYRIFLSPKDREQFASYEPALRKELSDYLLEHARQESFALSTRPQVEFHTDERLDLGEFGIQAQLLAPPEEEPKAEGPQAQAPSAGDFGHTMVYSPSRDARPCPLRRQRGSCRAGGGAVARAARPPRGPGTARRRLAAAPGGCRDGARAGYDLRCARGGNVRPLRRGRHTRERPVRVV